MDSWLADELSGSIFKDKRLTDRFKQVVQALSQGIGKTIPEVSGDWAMTKSIYRFLSNDRIDESEILSGHFEQTARRIHSCDGPVLVLHDTSEFSFKRSNPESIGLTRKGLVPRPLANGLREEYTACGVLMHASLAITPEGVPLGLACTRFWTRDVFKNTNQMKRHVNPTRIPIDQKESIRWLQNLESVNELAASHVTRLVHIGDRENDIYEYFCKSVEMGSYFLIRSCVNRLANESTIVEELGSQPRDYRHRISFTNEEGAVIETDLELRVKCVMLHPPIGKEKIYPSLKVAVVSASESAEPKDRERISWVFITNLPVSSKVEAVTVLDWYRQRWKIETYFKVLKSGFKAESSKLRTSERLTRLISIFCILAWRVQWITMLNRDDERYAPNTAFDEAERQVLIRYFKRQENPPRTLQDYINLVARLGGYLARSSDPPPGISVIWRGMNKLYDLRIGFGLVGN